MGEEVLKRMPPQRQAEAEVHDMPFGCGLASGRGSKFACEWRGQRECPNQCAVVVVPCGTCAVEVAQREGAGTALTDFPATNEFTRFGKLAQNPVPCLCSK